MEIIPIGTIRTPYLTLAACPRNIGLNHDECQIEVFEPYILGLDGLQSGSVIQLLYWLDKSKGSALTQKSRKTGETKGVFALRTPRRPNPIGSAVVTIESIKGSVLTVHGLDCLNGTPLIDIKPGCGFLNQSR